MAALRQPVVPRLAMALSFGLLSAWPIAAQPSIDGGRSELPGMKQDIFDQVQRNKKGQSQPKGKAPPECPKSDMMSPFFGLTFAGSEVYVKINNSTEPCRRLVSVGGANYSALKNASRTCGPAGEWKKRIAENLSSIFFQGGFDWVKSENETLEVITEDGTFEIAVTEARYADMLECWRYGCECEQSKNPVMKGVLVSLLAIAVIGLGWDGVKMLIDQIKGKKPPKHVECKKGHRMEEVKFARSHRCDICNVAGTMYQCAVSCNYDMCKACYKDAKKKIKEDWAKWVEKHPEDAKKSKKDKKEDKDDDDKKSDADEAKDSEKESDVKDSEKDTDAESKADKDTSDTGAGDGDETEEEEKKE